MTERWTHYAYKLVNHHHYDAEFFHCFCDAEHNHLIGEEQDD